MPQERKDLLEFDSYRIDREQRLLIRGQSVIRLAPKVFDTLLVLVESGGRIVEKDDLLKKVWPDTFVEEGSLARNISTLRKALGESPDDQKYILTIPKRGYRFVPEVRAAIAGAMPPGTAPAVTTRRKWAWLAAACALILIGSGAVLLRMRAAATKQPQIRSIAVLPLQNLSGDASQDYFSDGVTDALITSLSQIHAVAVISRSSVMRYKGTTKPLPEIAHELGVDAIVEGSVQRIGGRARITAQLIRASTDTHIWAKDYEWNLADILDEESEIAKAVAREIQIRITPAESQRLVGTHSANAAAQDEYLLARYYGYKLNDVDLRRAVDHYQQAIRLQPDYAAAYAGLSNAWRQRAVWGSAPFREVENPSREAALTALQLDPNLSEAHSAIGSVLTFYDWDWQGAENHFRRAIELDPNSVDVYQFHSNLLYATGRVAEAIAEGKRAVELDPLNSWMHSVYGRSLFRARKYQEAQIQYQRAIDLDSQDWAAYTRLADLYEQTGRYPEAVELLEQAPQIRGAKSGKNFELGRAHAFAGRRADALKNLASIRRRDVDPKNDTEIARLWFALGDKDQGFEWLQRAFDERQMVMYIAFDPVFDAVRLDPRFVALVERLKIPADNSESPATKEANLR